jgi:hypothetical protein
MRHNCTFKLSDVEKLILDEFDGLDSPPGLGWMRKAKIWEDFQVLVLIEILVKSCGFAKL